MKFDRPTPLQIDGETIPDVTSHEVTGGAAQQIRNDPVIRESTAPQSSEAVDKLQAKEWGV